MATAPKVNPPTSLAHIVLRTSRFVDMTSFYKKFLGAEASYENEALCFLRYDDEHHRIAIGNIPGTKPKDPTSSGLEHIAFAYNTLADLVLVYQQRKAIGIQPFWCVNHGPTTSMYYRDPDGNQIEIQVDNFDTPEAASDFMSGPLYAENPIGTDFDPENLAIRVARGEDERSIKARIEIGPRGLDSLPV
ncbi:putative ring-cleavage extradiol dioxygenase [Pyrenochaeta sp. MPI-SDFR-AT-0127]|nr:putative ring-cleavage extradiol dioxygenase [Pyrenochaeta sp. MPI-SDFR-AT-0127]